MKVSHLTQQQLLQMPKGASRYVRICKPNMATLYGELKYISEYYVYVYLDKNCQAYVKRGYVEDYRSELGRVTLAVYNGEVDGLEWAHDHYYMRRGELPPSKLTANRHDFFELTQKIQRTDKQKRFLVPWEPEKWLLEEGKSFKTKVIVAQAIHKMIYS